MRVMKKDPIAEALTESKDLILSACVQYQGTRDTQEDAYASFSDECYAIADGVGGMPHGEVASALSVETAVWAYRHVRTRPFYWDDRKLFMKRIFRTVNMRIWQKRREEGFEDGLATTLAVVMIGQRTAWVGSAGDSSVFIMREGNLVKLTHEDRDESGLLTKVLGIARLGLVPQFASVRFLYGDTLLLATDGVADVMSDRELSAILEKPAETNEDIGVLAAEIVNTAKRLGSTDNMTAYVIRRIPAPLPTYFAME